MQLKYPFSQEELDLLDDPLSLYDSLIKDTLPQNKLFIEILSDVTKRFALDPRYKQDPRFLQLWLKYADVCTDPEEIYKYLEGNHFFSTLSAFYESYCSFLEKKMQNSIIEKSRIENLYKLGIEKKAQPLERLKRNFSLFLQRNPCHKNESFPPSNPNNIGGLVLNELVTRTGIGTGTAGSLPSQTTNSWIKKKEISAYNSKMTNGGKLSFEEVKSLEYRGKSSKIQLINIDDEDDRGLPVFIPINADELTHFTCYRDNTIDLKEFDQSIINRQATIKDSKMSLQSKNLQSREESKLDPFELIMNGQSKQEKNLEEKIKKEGNIEREISSLSIGGNSNFIPLILPCSNSSINGIGNGIETGNNNENNNFPLTIQESQNLVKSQNLSLKIKDLNKLPVDPRKWKEINPNDIHDIEIIQQSGIRKVELLIRKIGNDQTVSSLKFASGDYLVAERLAENVFMGVELGFTTDENKQVIIKIIKNRSVALEEAYWRQEMKDEEIFPSLDGCCLYSDVAFLIGPYYGLTLEGILKNKREKIDNVLCLYFGLEILKLLEILIKKNLCHGQIDPNHLILNEKYKLILCGLGRIQHATVGMKINRERDLESVNNCLKMLGLAHVIVDENNISQIKLLLEEELEKGEQFQQQSHQSGIKSKLLRLHSLITLSSSSS